MKENFNIEVFLIRLYLLILILEAPIRYILNIFDLASLIYIKDLILGLLFIISITNITLNKTHIIIFVAIIISFFVSFIYIGNIYQIVFFLVKMGLPFFTGIFQFNNILNDIKNNPKFYEICFWISVIGIIINNYISYPWEGLQYSIGDYDIFASKNWSTVGKKRLSGFARVSYNAAAYIMFLAMIIQLNKNNSKAKKILCCIISIFAILLTTTKGILISCFLFYTTTFIDFKFNKKILINMLIIIMIILPIFSTMCDPIFDYLQENLDSTTYIKYFSSFRDRLENTWPYALSLATKDGNALLGRGLGGIGVSQSIYEPLKSSPADNMFVYLYVTFGINAFLLFYFIFIKINKFQFNTNEENYVYYFLLIICSYGIVINIIEEPLLCIIFGLCIGYISKKSERHNYENIDC